MCDLVIGDKIACYRLSVIGTKELCRCVPQLSNFVIRLLVQLIFELSISLSQDFLKFKLIADAIKIKRIARIEDNGLIGEVPIMGIVKAI